MKYSSTYGALQEPSGAVITVAERQIRLDKQWQNAQTVRPVIKKKCVAGSLSEV